MDFAYPARLEEEPDGRYSSMKRIDHALSAIGRRVCVSLEA